MGTICCSHSRHGAGMVQHASNYHDHRPLNPFGSEQPSVFWFRVQFSFSFSFSFFLFLSLSLSFFFFLFLSFLFLFLSFLTRVAACSLQLREHVAEQ
jgi:hypothetical protein